MGSPNSVDSASAAVNAGGASPVAQAQRSRVAFPDDIIALAVRWYVRYRLSYAEVTEWLAERGVLVDQSTIYRWVQTFLPLFGEAARKHRAPVGPDWRVDETYARIRGRWHYIYRAIDGQGGPLSASTGRGGAWRSASDQSVSDERRRARPWISQRAAAADAWPQVCCFSGDLHARTHLDAQHPPWFLPDGAVSPAAAGIRLGMDSARRSSLTCRGSAMACRSTRRLEALAALPPHLDAREPTGDALVLARALLERGATSEALRIAEHGLTMEGERLTLAHWLREGGNGRWRARAGGAGRAGRRS
jgi:hypothetical protein